MTARTCSAGSATSSTSTPAAVGRWVAAALGLVLLAGLVGSRPAVGQPYGSAFVESVPEDTRVVDVSDESQTMRRVAEAAPTTTALLASNDAFPDALAGGVLQDDAMLLPVVDGLLGPGVAALIESAGVQEVVVLGGTAAVPDSAVAQLPDSVDVRRLAGPERTATAATIAQDAAAAAAADGAPPSRVLVARARGTQTNPTAGFIDAIGAGVWAAVTGWPVLLVDQEPSADTRAALADIDPAEVVVVGGTAAVSDAAAEALADGRPVRRVAGPDRYTTAAAIAAEVRPDGADTVYLLDGNDPAGWRAGFAVAHPATLDGGVVLLADGSSLPDTTADALADLRPTRVVCLTAQRDVCLQARGAAGLPAPAEVVIDPTPGTPLTAGETVTVDLAGGGGIVRVTETGGCLDPGYDGSGTATRSGGCTATFDVVDPDGVDQAVTVSWAAVTASSPSVTGGLDFAATVLHNRWDFADAIDARTDPLVGLNGDSVGIQDGLLRWERAANGGLVYVPVLWAGFSEAIHAAPDGLVVPIDADRFRWLVMRLWSDAPGDWAIEARSCDPDPDVECVTAPARRMVYGGRLQGGWTTIVQDLGSNPGWYGEVQTFYVATTVATRIDDIRLQPALSDAAIDLTVEPGTQLVWDTDADPANNLDRASPTWGVLSRPRLEADTLPPGSYWVHATADGRTDTIGPLVLAQPPAPAITTPSPATAPDYATTVIGNAWDFAPGPGPLGTDDITAFGGIAEHQITADGLRATNQGEDPFVVLNLPAPLDPLSWRHLTIDYALDGPLDLSFDPGGGGHGRLLYKVGDPVTSPWQDGRAMVAYTNQRSYTFDLARPRIVEDGGIEWTRAPITAIRFDPNEDPGARQWTLSSVRLTGDQPSPGRVDLVVEDRSVGSGSPTTVRWHASTVEGEAGPPISAELPVTPGQPNRFTWDTCGTAGGRWFLSAVMTRDGMAVTASGETPVVVTNTSC